MVAKIFKIIDKLLDKAIDKLDEKEPTIHVESKQKNYNKENDTTTTYVKYTKNGKTTEEIKVNGRTVDPESEEAQKIRDRFNKSTNTMNKGFDAMDEGFKAMDRAFEQMDKTFERMDKIFDRL